MIRSHSRSPRPPRLVTTRSCSFATSLTPQIVEVGQGLARVADVVLNAVLLVPLLFAMIGIGRDRDLMGRFTIGRASTIAYLITTAVVVLCVAALAVTALMG